MVNMNTDYLPVSTITFGVEHIETTLLHYYAPCRNMAYQR